MQHASGGNLRQVRVKGVGAFSIVEVSFEVNYSTPELPATEEACSENLKRLKTELKALEAHIARVEVEKKLVRAHNKQSTTDNARANNASVATRKAAFATDCRMSDCVGSRLRVLPACS